MARNLEIVPKLALFLMMAAVVSSVAEVKLRIYLLDGTLQAGNLVTETADSFVILTRDGRAEIKKEKIMFINGKTLKQWQERPDKLFQTEIIPSEIPNPAYVNDKAAPTVIKPVTPLPAVAPAKPVTPASVSSITEKLAPMSTQPVAKKTQPELKEAVKETPVSTLSKPAATKPEVVAQAALPAAPPAAAVVPDVKPRTRVRHARHPKPAPVVSRAAKEQPVVKSVSKSRPAAALNQWPQPESAGPAVAIAPPSPFVREDFGDYHYQRALAFLKAGARGRAIQELHVSTVLDRQNAAPILLIGRLYMEQGQDARAEKYFSHPLVKKNDEVKKFSMEMEQLKKKTEMSRWIFYGSTSLGALAWLPLLVGWRRLRRPKTRVITAESAVETATLQESVTPDEMTSELEKASIPESAAPVSELEPAKVPEISVEKPPFLFPKPAAASETPVVPPIAFPKRFEEPPLPETPPASATPTVNVPDEPVPMIVKKEPPVSPPVVPPPVEEPTPIEVSHPTAPVYSNGLDTESILRLAGMVDKALRQGNAYALEEKFGLARREYRTALALRPTCAEAYLGLGYLCFAQGQWELALEYYVKCMEIDPHSADAHYGVGRVLLETDRTDEAVPEFQKTLALDPAFDDARDTLSVLGRVA